jgi:hypothetical protein
MYVSWCEIVNASFITDIAVGQKLSITAFVVIESAKYFELP